MNILPLDDHLMMLIDRLNDAINVCYTAPEKPDEEGYPYATGYSRSAMMGVADDLSKIVKEIRENHETRHSDFNS